MVSRECVNNGLFQVLRLSAHLNRAFASLEAARKADEELVTELKRMISS
jgi:hypothetical protein